MAGSGSAPIDQYSLTAASRRSLVRISVPVWGIILSEPLDIVDLVSRYLTNYLMSRMPILIPTGIFNYFQ